MSVSDKSLRAGAMGERPPDRQGDATLMTTSTATTALASTTSPAPGLLPVRSLPFVLVALLVAFMLLLAVRGLVDPIGAAHGYGIDLASPLDGFYLHVKADRDLTLGATFLALLLYRRPMPLALFTAACTIAPTLDCALVALDPRGHAGYALGVHGSAALYGIVTAYLLVRAARRGA